MDHVPKLQHAGQCARLGSSHSIGRTNGQLHSGGPSARIPVQSGLGPGDIGEGDARTAPTMKTIASAKRKVLTCIVVALTTNSWDLREVVRETGRDLSIPFVPRLRTALVLELVAWQ